MQFNQFVTDYDENLTGDTYVDPLGVQVIWSVFGSQVFRNRVNSISNDVRNYTLNLLNHRIIRDLVDDDSVVVGRWLEESIGKKSSLSFRQACLIYLENLFTYSLISADNNQGVNTAGVLGGAKGRREYEELNSKPELILSHREDAHLLVRQLGLGVSGRYKTPFMEIGFFDASYHYRLPESEGLWAKADVLFQHSKNLESVYNKARSHLADLITMSVKKSSVPPRQCFAKDIPIELKRAYQSAFATAGRVGTETRDFWLASTGLNQGAAGALLQVLDAEAAHPSQEHVSEAELFQRAGTRCNLDGAIDEARKIQHILTLEPLLAELDLLFTLALHRRHQSIDEVASLWTNMGRNNETLLHAAQRILELPSLFVVVQGTAKFRLNRLLEAASLSTVEQQLRELLSYHAGVMRSRGQLPWVIVKGGAQIKVDARTQSLPEKDKRPLGTWVNRYYLPQFNNLVNGFRGEVA